MIHQKAIKLGDFGLSKRIEEASGTTNVFGMVPYIAPERFSKSTRKLDKKNDVYSTGVLLWEISSGIPPFINEVYDLDLTMKIKEGYRETPVPDTPVDYADLYIGKC